MPEEAIRPGYGFRELHLGLSSVELGRRYGKPLRRQKSSALREYWIYPDFNCIVSRRTGRILSLFVEPAAPLRPQGGLADWTERDVKKTYGSPEKEGGNFASATGAHVNRWISYPAGIGFHFNSQGRVCLISIFRARKASTKMHANKEPHMAKAA